MKKIGKQPITDEMRARFERLAPAALKRRSGKQLSVLWLNSFQFVVLGVSSLVGMFFFDWSPLTLFLLLVAGILAGILVDTLRWLVARETLSVQVERFNEDKFVWTLVDAFRAGSSEVEAGNLLRFRAALAVALDWLFGLIALAGLAFLFLRMGIRSPAELFPGAEQRIALMIAIAVPLIQGVLAVSSWLDPEASSIDDFGAGARGIVLVVLVVLFAFNMNSPASFRTFMMVINGFTAGLGAVALLGCFILTEDTEWLRRHLRK